jgi:hypothetical protein
MFRRYVIIINVLLIAGSLFLLTRIISIWGTDRYPKTASLNKEKPTSFLSLNMCFSPPKPKNYYQLIVNKDLFRPERTEWKSPTPEGENALARVPPQLVLYGIVITKAVKYAWIQEQGKMDRLIKISEGGEINGWKVINIESNSLSVKNGAQVLTFNLIQPGKPKTRSIPKAIIQSQPKNFTNPYAKTQAGPAPTLVPQPLPVPPPPALPQKK